MNPAMTLLLISATLPFILLSCNERVNRNSDEPHLPVKQYINRTVFNDSLFVKKLIDSMELAVIVDDAKWRMYCLYCDRVANLEQVLGRNIKRTFGELELQIARIDFDQYKGAYCGRANTEISFVFKVPNIDSADSVAVVNNFFHGEFCKYYYNRETPNVPLYIGYYYGSSICTELDKKHNMNDSLARKNMRILFPIQPEVINYLWKNINIINPWFLNEAKKRGVLDNSKKPS